MYTSDSTSSFVLFLAIAQQEDMIMIDTSPFKEPW